VLTGPNVILALKVAVSAVTLLLLASLEALRRGRYRLHGRINLLCFVLTAAALLGLEVIVRLVAPDVFAYLEADPVARRSLTIHLTFALPAAAIMPLMLWTGSTGRRNVHLTLAVFFATLWSGTVITGLFYLPHTAL
jgi:uncharacterized membrane protein YozB (DUF420 family)